MDLFFVHVIECLVDSIADNIELVHIELHIVDDSKHLIDVSQSVQFGQDQVESLDVAGEVHVGEYPVDHIHETFDLALASGQATFAIRNLSLPLVAVITFFAYCLSKFLLSLALIFLSSSFFALVIVLWHSGEARVPWI